LKLEMFQAAAQDNNWYNSIHTTTCSVDPDSILWIS